MPAMNVDQRPRTCAEEEVEVDCSELRVRKLRADDLAAVEQHLLALGPSDRRARFHGHPTDSAIAAHVRALDPNSSVFVGAFGRGGRLVGLAEAHPTETPHTVEVAVSIDPALRRRGLGQRLVATAWALACGRGAQTAEFVFTADNRPLVGLVMALGGRIKAPGHALIERSASHAGRKAA